MIGPEEIWAEAVRTLERDKPFALATVVNVRGSTPREVGAKMIVRDDGQFGTIGGGCGEAEVFRKARVLLEDGGEARLAEVDLTGDFDQQQIGTCGGIMDVFIDLWRPRADLEIARRLADAADHNRPAALLTVVDPGTSKRDRPLPRRSASARWSIYRGARRRLMVSPASARRRRSNLASALRMRWRRCSRSAPTARCGRPRGSSRAARRGSFSIRSPVRSG